MKKFVGLYSGSDQVIGQPEYFDLLQREIGLTHLIGFGDYQLSPEVWERNPMPPGGEAFAPSRGSDDDEPMRQAISMAHDKGLAILVCSSGWHGGGDRYAEMCMKDMHGRPISEAPDLRYAREQYSMAYCPGNERLNDWLCAVFADVARRYEVDGFDLTHCRYTAPAFLHNLFGCGCPRCAALAGKMGYDFERMRRSALAFWERIQRLDARDVRQAADRGLGLLDLSEWLGIGAGLADWFAFRAGVITANLQRFKAAACAAAGREIVFGSDTFPPSFALLVGHRYRDFTEWADFTSPLLAHVEYFVLSTFATYADLLCQWIAGLAEEEALRFVYRLFGYDRIPEMPTSLEGFGIETPDCEVNCEALGDIVELELWRARLYNSGVVPSYPVIKGGTWPAETVHRLVKAAEEIGHEGIVFQGTEALVDS